MPDGEHPDEPARGWWARPLLPLRVRSLGSLSLDLSRGRLVFGATQIAALLVAIYCGRHGYQLVDDKRLAIDRALTWYAVALVLMAYYAWNGSIPRLTALPKSVAAYVRAHPLELALLAGIVAIAAFVRLFEYGTLPPTGYIYLEEHINAGVAFLVLEGDRPYAYPLVRYSTALGVKLFGPSTLGLRAPLLATGIVVVIPFYLLMRDLVDRPAALFATALYASSRALADPTVYFQVPMLAVVLMTWMMIRGLRTGSAVWFVPAAALAALVSYEYEAFKAVPLFAGSFLIFVALRAVVWPLPASLKSALQRIASMAPHAVKVAVVIGVIALIGIGPMVAQRHRGENIYFSSLDRQRLDRDNRGTPGLFAPNWEKQLKFSVQVFTPFERPDYNDPGSVSARGVIDKWTSALLWASVIAGAIFFWRGYRAMFVGWFVAGVLASSLLLSNWAPWKMLGWIPAGLVLVGFFTDDILALLKRADRRALAAGALLLVVMAAYILSLNVHALKANAEDDRVLREWSNAQSQLFSICDQLRKRPDDNYAIVHQRVRAAWGFTKTPKDAAERLNSWGDFRFVCWELQGTTTSSLQEAWPLYVTEDRHYSLIQNAPPVEVPPILESLDAAMPELGEPDLLKAAPANTFSTIVFDTTREELNARKGLVLRWLDAGGSAIGDESIALDPEPEQPAPEGATTFSLSGLVYLPDAATASLVPFQQAGGRVTITVDGQRSYDGNDNGAETPSPLIRGWHLVEIAGATGTELPLPLTWRWTGGATSYVGPEEMFGLADTNVWVHTRNFQTDAATQFLAQRYDFQPHFAAFDGLRVNATTRLPLGTKILSDSYRGIWTAPTDGQYRFAVQTYNAPFSLRVDGRPLAPGTATFDLTAGDHLVEITFEPVGEGFTIGGQIWFYDPLTNQPMELVVRPY